MTGFQNLSLKRKQVLVIMLTTGIALLLACAAFATYEVLTFRKNMVLNLSTLAEIVGNNTSAALDFGNADDAATTLAALKAEPDLVGACIYTRAGTVFAVYDRSGDRFSFKAPALPAEGPVFTGERLTLVHPIVYKGETAGFIYLESDMRALYSRLTRYAVIAGCVFLIALALAFLISTRLQRLISDPILRLVQTAHAVARDKDYSVRVTNRSQDEIGVLINGFNEMLTQIQERDATLQKARAELESRVTERTQELAGSLSLLHATLESTADGILVADGEGKITSWNEKFGRMWRIPEEIMESRDEEQMLDIAMPQLKDPAQFIAKVQELYGHAEKESCDLLEFKDGRIFERYSKPQRVGEEFVGRVWSFRDVTERRRAEEALRESQALYHSLVEQMPVGILRKDREGRFVFVNAAFCRLKGLKAEQVLGRTPQELAKLVTAERNAPQIEIDLTLQGAAHHEQIMATGRQLEFEEYYPHKNQYLQVMKSPVFGPDGSIIGSQGILFDITERKRAEAELSRERDLVTSLLDNSPDYIYFKDLESRFLRSSKSLAERFGLSPEELIGLTDFDLYGEEHARPAFEDERQIIRTGRAVLGKIEQETRKQGEPTWVLTSKMPLHNKDGGIVGTFGISKDITAIKESEARLDEAHKQLLETSRLAGMAEVATSVLHNVGNVLNSVNVSCALVSDKLRLSKVGLLAKSVELMKPHGGDLAGFFTHDPKGKQLPAFLSTLADRLAAEQQEMLGEIKSLVSNIDHIKEIVAMQQSYAKVSGVTELIPVVELVEDALRMNAGALARHHVRVIREFSKVPPVVVDKHKILQILINLIRNAKYALDECVNREKQLTLRVGSNADGMVEISVIDNGVGIAAENMVRVFGLGFTTRKEGHGFGLHNGALMAKEMGGSLTVHSDGPGTGAKFTLTFPGRTGET